MSGTQSPSSANKSRPPRRPPLAQALRKAIESVEASLDQADALPKGQSPLHRPPPKTNLS